MVKRENTIKVKGKVCLLGDLTVGKTSLIRRFVFNTFEERYISTIGTNITKKSITLPYPEFDRNVDLTLMIWDIMGQHAEKLHTTLALYEHYIPPTNYFRNAKAAIIVCDITRKSTLNNMKKWIDHLFKLSGEVPIMVVGNKIDLIGDKDFEIDMISKFCKTIKGESTLTSAKTGDNVEKMFYTIGSIIVDDAVNWDEEI